MSKPEDVPQRVWDEAAKLAREYRQWARAGNTTAVLSDHAEDAMADTIARAILAAEQREREACLAICDKEAFDAKRNNLPHISIGAMWCATAIKARTRGSSHD